MTKVEFIDRLILAAETARKFASSLSYVSGVLPEIMVYSLFEYDDTDGARGPEGTVKFLGGRFLKPEDLKYLDASRAGSLLWVDGKIPSWINITVSNCTQTETELFLMFSKQVVPAEIERFYPDINMQPGNPLVPFRIRGPGEETWTNRGKNA